MRVLSRDVDSVTITVYGRGGHAAMPHNTVDPVVLASRIVMALQTIVSRENNPLDPVVITVGSIHGGTQGNVIPDEVKTPILGADLHAGGAGADAGRHPPGREGRSSRGRARASRRWMRPLSPGPGDNDPASPAAGRGAQKLGEKNVIEMPRR